MSLILEALRKSEAERRLGQAPDVLAPMPVMHASPAPSRRRGGVIAGVVLAVAGVLALGGWWLVRGSPAPVTPAEVASSSRPSHTTPPSAAIVAMPVNAPPARTSAPVPVAAPAMTPEPTRDDVRPDSTTAIAAPGQPATHVPVPPPVAAGTRETNPATIAFTTKRSASSPSPMGSPPAAVPDDAPAAAATTAVPAEPALLPVTALSTSERGDLPALKVTMHVYDADPARRFMVVDGQRVAEGAQIAEGIILVHVRRDGAEIDARGRRLFLPNP